jgi:hypothetical protein
MAQETIYEVAERLVRENHDFKLVGYTEYQNGRFNGIVEGIEWQQEQDKKMEKEHRDTLLNYIEEVSDLCRKLRFPTEGELRELIDKADVILETFKQQEQ